MHPKPDWSLPKQPDWSQSKKQTQNQLDNDNNNNSNTQNIPPKTMMQDNQNEIETHRGDNHKHKLDMDPLSNQTRQVSIDLALLDSVVQKVMRNKDLWVLKILPFLGPGHYLYVALVCKRFQGLYLAYFKTIKPPPMVVDSICHYAKRPTLATNTFYSAAFSSVSCAKLWDNVTKGNNNRLKSAWGRDLVCTTIARHGCLPVLKWARGEDSPFPWDWHTCEAAAAGGHLEVLIWARENQCPCVEMGTRKEAAY